MLSMRPRTVQQGREMRQMIYYRQVGWQRIGIIHPPAGFQDRSHPGQLGTKHIDPISVPDINNLIGPQTNPPGGGVEYVRMRLAKTDLRGINPYVEI